MRERLINFGAGPAMMPEAVLRRIREEAFDYCGSSVSVFELGHRTPEFEAILGGLRDRIRRLLAVPKDYDILFCQGGGRLQFAMVPMNLFGAGAIASYIVTGSWSRNAQREALRIGRVQTAFAGNGTHAPRPDEYECLPEAAYLYYCDNETVHGVEFRDPPKAPERVPLVADMSSNFLSRPVDVNRFGLIWACAQKNFGIAGLSVVIIRRDLLGLSAPNVPTLMNFSVYSRTGSTPNTPPIFAIYVAALMAEWIEAEGGLEEMNSRALARSSIIYSTLDELRDVYTLPVEPESRSRMNVVFRLADEEATGEFLAGAARRGLINLAGHRSVGGIRASLYNSMPMKGAELLAEYLREYAGRTLARKRSSPAQSRGR